MERDEYIPPIDLRSYAEVLRRRWRTVVAIGLLGLLLAGGYTIRLPDVYRSEAAVLVQPVGVDPARSTVRVDQLMNLSTEREVAMSGSAAAYVAAGLDGALGVGQVLSAMEVVVPGDTQVLIMVFSDTRPERAQRGAELLAEFYLQERREEAVAAVREVSDEIAARIAEVEEELAANSEVIAAAPSGSVELELARGRRSVILSQIDQLHAQLANTQTLGTMPGRVISPAATPTAAFGPARAQHLAGGLLLGLFAGVLLALLRERVDDRVRRPSDVEREQLVPLLGAVPLVPERTRRVWEQDPLVAPEAVAEAYRRLRATVSVRLGSEGTSSLVVTSAVGGEGKSTTAASLAVSFARAGVQTLLVSGDLRWPSIHRMFGIRNEYGLAELLLGLAELPDVVHDVRGLPMLGVVPSGRAPAAPSDLLQSPALASLLGGGDEERRLVIFDAPPVRGLADALALGRVADATLLVIRDRVSRMSEVESATGDLQTAGAVVLGAVMLTAEGDEGITTPPVDTEATPGPTGRVLVGSGSGQARRQGWVNRLVS